MGIGCVRQWREEFRSYLQWPQRQLIQGGLRYTILPGHHLGANAALEFLDGLHHLAIAVNAFSHQFLLRDKINTFCLL